MTIQQVPHIPTDIETATARGNFPHDDITVLNMLEAASHAMGTQDMSKALDILKAIAMARPDEPRIYESFGMAYQLQGRAQDARACFEHALSLSPLALYARVNLGEMAWREDRDPERAKELLAMVIERDASGSLVGRAELTMKQIEEALP